MGYTHAYLDASPTPKLVEDTQRIAEATQVAVAGPLGHGDPHITTDGIHLNGDATRGENHETFAIVAGRHFNFCKTAGLPYDEVVTAILVSAVVNHAVGEILSEGTYEDWAEGINLYERAIAPLSDDDRTRLRAAITPDEDSPHPLTRAGLH